MSPSLQSLRLLLALAASGALLGACGTEPSESGRLQLALHAGDQQIGEAGTTLANPLSVRVTRGEGRPAAGITVRWAAETGGGSVSAPGRETVTGEDGVAQVFRTLGAVAGPQTTTATLDTAGGAIVRFSALARIQGAVRITRHPAEEGLVRTDTVLATLAVPYRVLVLDQDDRPVPGVTVHWSPLGGSGGVVGATSVTDALGVAAMAVALGASAGVNRAYAAVPGLVGSPVSFEATALPGQPAAILDAGGNGQMLPRAAGSVSYGVRVNDAYGNAVQGVPITWTVLAGGGTITQAQPETHGPGAYATVHLGAVEGIHITTASSPMLPGLSPVMFTTTVVGAIVNLTGGDYWSCWYYGLCGRFDPAEVTIPAGSSVGWIWGIYGPCDVVFEDAPHPPESSLTIVAPGKHRRTFPTPGTYRYRCTLQSTSFVQGMVGIVRVQ